MNRPPRTLGVSLALLLCALLFTVGPLVEVGVRLRLRQHFREVPTYTEQGDTWSLTGGNVGSVPLWALGARATVAVVFLGLVVLAWHRRPMGIRWVLLGAVLLLTAISVGADVRALLTPRGPAAPFDSAAGVARTLMLTRVSGTLLAVLYVVWYLNRWPARAFFRGVYPPGFATPEP